MRMLLSLASFALIAGTAAAQQYSHEPNTYRYGATYKIANANSPSSCANLCASDRVCRSWSFQRATQGLGSASCELKAVVGKAVKNPLMTSGINPRLASVGQARGISPSTSGTLLGAPATRAPVNVIRNNTVTAAPRPLRPAPAPIIRQAPAPVRSAPAPVRRVVPAPAQPQLRSGEFISPVAPPPASVQRTLPPPPQIAAPVRSVPSLPPAAPSNQRVNVPVTQGELPEGAILREAPPPQVSFDPVDSLPAPTPTRPVPTRPVPPPPATAIPQPSAAPTTPYNNLAGRKFPEFSVNNDNALTPEELEETQEVLEEQASDIVEDLDLDDKGSDIASDIGQPVPPQRRPGGGGS